MQCPQQGQSWRRCQGEFWGVTFFFCSSLQFFYKIHIVGLKQVVENPILDVQSTEGAAHSAIQYFENMRNFLEAVKNMKLLTFEASDLEKVCFFLFTLAAFAITMNELRLYNREVRRTKSWIASFA